MIRRDTHNNWNLFDDHELVIDSFAGGGGASIGIEAGLGRRVDVAINHDPEAVAMHRVNHPHTVHLCQDVWDADPREVCGGRPVGLAWFSPDCTHFSKARGGKPIRTTKSRDLAWVVIRWAATVRPRVIMLENVEEFQTWGPLVDGRPCPKRKGSTFRSWTKQLRDLGYQVQWRELRACDYGAPTIRKRLFLVARCDGQPIIWPEVTHGDGEGGSRNQQGRPGGEYPHRGTEGHAAKAGRRGGGGVSAYRTKVASDLKPYRTAAECIDWSIPCPSIFERKRPLAENTLKRIAAGIKRYVIDAAEPFIVPLTHHGKRRNHPMDEPLPTITGAHRGEHALCVPTLVQTGYGERQGQAPRVPGLHKPLGTIVGTTKHALVSAWMVKHFGGMVGVGIDTPCPTITAVGTQNQVAVAHLTNFYTSNTRGGEGDPRQPLKTITAGGNHAGLVAALLVKYYGADQHGQGMREPLHTIPTKERFGLITVHLNGEPYVITDIGMRMLQPHELYRAQGFPADYVIDHGIDAEGRRITLTKTAQVRMCGNSVSPVIPEALVRANLVDVPQPAEVEEVMA